MKSRRAVITTFAGLLASVPIIRAAAEPAAAEEPVIKLIKSKPPVLDFGDGVKVPCTKDAFLTLWEAPTYWMTFGAGMSAQSARSKAEAGNFAKASMRLLLLTLAFAPERMQKVDGNGWRLNMEVARDYVRGELDLPGKPSPPMTDASLGFGNSDQSVFIGSLPDVGPGGFGGGSAVTGINPAMMLGKVNAFCLYVVKKADVSLDDVRAKAKLDKT